MGVHKPYLDKFIQYCSDEAAFTLDMRKGRNWRNFRLTMREQHLLKQQVHIRERYNRNIALAGQTLEQVGLVHNTSLESLMSILSTGALFSIEELEVHDISLNYRISSSGINEDMHKYVFAHPFKSDWLYGLYEIKFKKGVESLTNACFIPQCHLQYEAHQINDLIMDLKDWRTYLAEFIAVNLENPLEYFQECPVYRRPEMLFEDSISADYIEKITCKGQGARNELIQRITTQLGHDSPYLRMITWVE